MGQVIKVMIVDDHTMVREGFKQLLVSEEDIRVVAEASNGEEALSLAAKSHADVIVLDISMPQMGGLEAISLLLEAAPKAKVIILSMYRKDAFAQEALKAGAFAYILKGDSSDELLTAIRTVSRGQYYFSGQLRASLVSSFIGGAQTSSSGEADRYQNLSDREKQFYHLILKGHSTNSISKLLGISSKTGQKHHTSVVKKLGTSNAMELLQYGIKIGLIDPNILLES